MRKNRAIETFEISIYTSPSLNYYSILSYICLFYFLLDMKKTIVIALLLAFASSASAVGYLERFHDLDQQLICAILWFVVPVVTLMLIVGGVLMMTEDPQKKYLGKAVVKNAILGLALVLCFILVSIALMPTISLSVCV